MQTRSGGVRERRGATSPVRSGGECEGSGRSVMAREGVSRLGKYWKQAIGNRSGIRPRDGGVRDGGAAGKS